MGCSCFAFVVVLNSYLYSRWWLFITCDTEAQRPDAGRVPPSQQDSVLAEPTGDSYTSATYCALFSVRSFSDCVAVAYSELRYPNLYEVRLIDTKKDIAFVEYTDEASSTTAKDALHNYKLDGENKIKVRWALLLGCRY